MRATLCLLAPAGRGDLAPTLYCPLEQPTWAELLETAHALLGAAPAVGARAGLASTPLLATWAAQVAAPGQVHPVPPPEQAMALAPVPLVGLPGLSLPLQRELRALRLFTLGDLAAIPQSLVAAVLGHTLVAVQALACGTDPRLVPLALPDPLAASPLPVVRQVVAPDPRQPPTLAALQEALTMLSAGLAAALAILGRAAAGLRLTLGYRDLAPLARPVRCLQPCASPAALHQAATPLLAPLLRARRRSPQWLALAVTAATDVVAQPPLPLPEARVRLQAAITTIHARFGPHVLQCGLPGPPVLTSPARRAHELRPSPHA
jgi:DNA polymerase-4